MFRAHTLTMITLAGLFSLAGTHATAQSADVSPTLMLESLPSAVPGYRRMVRVHYLNGNDVSVSYQALNRSEFAQAPGTADVQAVSDCARGAASTLNALRAFERADAARKRAGQTPEPVRFCIKGVPGWEAGAKATWLDPIFNGMPYAATLKSGS